MSEYYSGRLSELQKEILYAIANNTINTSECVNAYENGIAIFDHNPYEHDSGKVKYSKVFYDVCESHWDGFNVNGNVYHNTKEIQSKKVSFSRSVHNLVEEKKLVSALALAWVVFESGPAGNYYEDILGWQGGGGDSPRYKLLRLVGRGWSVVREIFDETMGMCPYLKEEIFEKKVDDAVEWWENKS